MKDPAFNFYSDNFLSGTMFFTDEQVGKYIRLLCAQHQTGHLEEKHMIFICKTYDEDIWKKFKKDDSGLFYNERLEVEINKRKAYSESRSNNKKGKVKVVKEKSKNTSKSYDNHMGIGIGIGIINIDFEVFWNAYDKKVGQKDKIKAKWDKLKDSERQCIIDYIPKYKAAQPDKKYRKNPDTFLNKEGWKDEIIDSSINNSSYKQTPW